MVLVINAASPVQEIHATDNANLESAI